MRLRPGYTFTRARYTWDELAVAVRKLNSTRVWACRPYRTSWELADAMVDGRQEVAAKAEGLFQAAIDAVLPETVGGLGERIGSPVGSFPNVPAFLSGHPMNMYRREESPSLGPVRLMVDLTSSSGTGAETMLARGIAIAALAYAIQCTRPVELWGVTQTENPREKEIHVSEVRIGLAPLDLSRVAVAVATIGLGRHMYRAHGRWSSYGGLLWPTQTPQELYDLGPDDVYIPGGHLDRVADIEADPMRWLLGQLSEQDREKLKTQTTGTARNPW